VSQFLSNLIRVVDFKVPTSLFSPTYTFLIQDTKKLTFPKTLMNILHLPMPLPKDRNEMRLQEALKAHEADPNLSLRQLSLIFEVPKATLHNGISQHSTQA